VEAFAVTEVGKVDKKKSANIVLGVSALIFGAVIMMIGRNTNLAFYSGRTPGPAFLPVIAAWGIVLCGLILIVGALVKKAADSDQATKKDANTIWIFKKKDLRNIVVVIGTSSLMVYLTPHLGMLLSFALGIAVMTKFLGTPGWKVPVFVGVLGLTVLYVVFDYFFMTLLPRGIFGF
jgi:cell division protein FtsW (lipid II flippase)